MTYDAEINRNNPTAIVFLIDQSGSMQDPQGGPEGPQGTKAENLAVILNRILNDLVIRCTKGTDIYRYFQVGVIGYTTDPSGKNFKIGSALGGKLAQQPLHWIDVLADNPLRIEQRLKAVPDGAGGLVNIEIAFPVWLEPVAVGGTPMCAALQSVYQILGSWIVEHPTAYPPIVIHVTDGEATDGNPVPPASNLKNLATSNGNVLLFNLHLSSHMVYPTLFPDAPDRLADEYARMLFEMSSELPIPFLRTAAEMQISTGPESRAFAFNADLSATVRFIEIGTRQTSIQTR